MVRIAVFDGLIHWWAFGDCATTLLSEDDVGFPGSVAVIADNIYRFGLPAVDGLYTNGGVPYQGLQKVGKNWRSPGAPWACRYDTYSLEQDLQPDFETPSPDPDGINDTFTIDVVPNPLDHFALYKNGTYMRPGGVDYTATVDTMLNILVLVFVPAQIPAPSDVLETIFQFAGAIGTLTSPVIDPAAGWGGFEGRAPTTVPDSFTFNIWAKPHPNGYFIERSGALMLTYLCGDVASVSGSERGWAITANYSGTLLGFNPESGFFQLRSKNGADIMPNMSLGSFHYLDSVTTGWVMLTVTYDGTTINCYQSRNVPGIGFVTTNTDQADQVFHHNAEIAFGARNNSGVGDGQFSSPFFGAYDEALMWNRALSFDEINQIPTACNGRTKGKARFTAVQPEAHKLFAHAKKLRGASGSTVAWDVAGLYTEPGEPTGSAVTDGLFQTAWFKWVCPSNGTYTFTTADSSPADVYSQSPTNAAKLWNTLTVWTGVTLAGLSEVVSSDDSCTDPATFAATAGTEYLIQVGCGKTGENGKVSLSWG